MIGESIIRAGAAALLLLGASACDPRYETIEACYLDEIGYNTIPKGSSSGVLGNTQLELSGVEHRRRRNIYGRHLVGGPLTKRIPALQRLAIVLSS